MTMLHKRSAVPGKVPLLEDLAEGQLALNTADAVAFMRRTIGGVASVAKVGGPGYINAVATTSQSAVTLTGIPSWATDLDLIFNGITLGTGTASLLIYLRSSAGNNLGTYKTVSTRLKPGEAISAATADAINLRIFESVADVCGTLQIRKSSANGALWTTSHNMRISDGLSVGGGLISGVSAPPAQIHIATSAGIFTAGTIGLRYR